MEEHVYQTSVIWWIITEISSFAYYVGIPLVFVSTCIWAARSRSSSSYLGLWGGVLMIGGFFSRMAFSEVSWVALGGMQPSVDQNPFVLFFFLHGMHVGGALLGFTLCWHFIRAKHV